MALPQAAYMPAPGPTKTWGIDSVLEKAGIPPRIRRSVDTLVPEEIRALNVYRQFPERSFGLVGESGIGKSSAFAAAIRLTTAADSDLEWRWVCWANAATRMKHMSARREWDHPDATTIRLIDWAKEDPEHHILVLDDLGMEFPKADKARDADPTKGWVYTSEQLELLIDEMWNHECRLFWTSQRKVTDLEGYYGSRFMSRLCGLAPDAELPPGMPDLRTRGK